MNNIKSIWKAQLVQKMAQSITFDEHFRTKALSININFPLLFQNLTNFNIRETLQKAFTLGLSLTNSFWLL